jgi:hypothetical protein
MRHEIAASARTNDGCLVIYCTDKTVITIPPISLQAPVGSHILIEKIGQDEKPRDRELEALRNFIASLARGDFDDQPKDVIFGVAGILCNKFNI